MPRLLTVFSFRGNWGREGSIVHEERGNEGLTQGRNRVRERRGTREPKQEEKNQHEPISVGANRVSSLDHRGENSGEISPHSRHVDGKMDKREGQPPSDIPVVFWGRSDEAGERARRDSQE